MTETAAVRPAPYSREGAAGRLGVCLRTLDELLLTGKIASIKIGRRRVVTEDAIQDFLRRNEKRVKF
jgi:excisionase family DNA binding protein